MIPVSRCAPYSHSTVNWIHIGSHPAVFLVKTAASSPKWCMGLRSFLWTSPIRAVQYKSVTGRAPFVPYSTSLHLHMHRLREPTLSSPSQKQHLFFFFWFMPLIVVPSAHSLHLFFCFSFLPLFSFVPMSSFPPQLVEFAGKHSGGGVCLALGGGSASSCCCCGLAACFILMLLPARSEFGAHWVSCEVRNINFLNNVWMMQLCNQASVGLDQAEIKIWIPNFSFCFLTFESQNEFRLQFSSVVCCALKEMLLEAKQNRNTGGIS